MKFLFLLITAMLLYNHGYPQQHQPTAYLQVKFVKDHDVNKNRIIYYHIAAEPGCNRAKDIYKLFSYSNTKALDTIPAMYYGKQNEAKQIDTAASFYNYFSSPTEALNFMASRHWILVTVFSELSSGYTYENGSNGNGLVPITTVSSGAVYCFKKEE